MPRALHAAPQRRLELVRRRSAREHERAHGARRLVARAARSAAVGDDGRAARDALLNINGNLQLVQISLTLLA